MSGSTMSKNFLVLKNYKITDNTKWYNDRTNETNLAENYRKMEDICVKSAFGNVEGLNEVRVFRGEADNIRDVFKKNFYEIYELWQEGHNILYSDLDVVFTQPTDYFVNDNIFYLNTMRLRVKTYVFLLLILFMCLLLSFVVLLVF